MDREELNLKAHDLNERARELKVRQSLSDELQDECKELRATIRMLRGACSKLPTLPKPTEGSLTGLLLRQRQLQSEIEVWSQVDKDRDGGDSRREAETIHAKRKLEESLSQLGESLEAVKQDRAAAKKDLQREKKSLEETRMILEALREKVKSAEEGAEKTRQSAKDSGRSRVLEEKVERCQANSEALMNHLQSFVEEHLTLDSEDVEDKGRRKQKENGLKQTTLTSARTSLTQFIKALLDHTLTYPHQPYISAAKLNKEYFLLLLRSGVIQRHPDRLSLVKMTPFHH